MIIKQNAHKLFKTRHYFFANRLGFIKSIGFTVKPFDPFRHCHRAQYDDLVCLNTFICRR